MALTLVEIEILVIEVPMLLLENVRASFMAEELTPSRRASLERLRVRGIVRVHMPSGADCEECNAIPVLVPVGLATRFLEVGTGCKTNACSTITVVTASSGRVMVGASVDGADGASRDGVPVLVAGFVGEMGVRGRTGCVSRT
jgi:hypothetical protein